MERLFTDNTSDINLAHQIVAKHYDDLSNHRIEVFRNGYDHVVVVVDKETAYRFAKNQEYLDKMPVVSRFLQEFAPSSPVTVPVSNINHDGDTTYEQYRFLPGKPLDENLAKTFSTESLMNIGTRIGYFLSAMHQFPSVRATEIGIPSKSPSSEWRERYASIKRHVVPIVSNDESEWINVLFEKHLPMLPEDASDLKVIHFDIKPDHVIVNPDSQELVGLIDFGDMKIGDPAYDFSFFALYPVDLTPRVLESYNLPHDSDFMKRVSFYQHALPLMDLDHALEIGSTERVDKLKRRLSVHIETSHLLQ